MTPLEIVNAFIAAVEAQDVDGAIEFVDPEVSYENVPIDPIVGRDGVAATLNGFLGPVSEVDWRGDGEWEVGRTVINERVDRFKIGDGWLELPVAGFFEVSDAGLITLWRDYFDMGSYVAQLEALTATG